MTDVQKLKQERTKLFEDLFGGIIPERVPIMVGMSSELVIEKAGLDMGMTQWTLDNLDKAFDDVLKNMNSDQLPSDAYRVPIFHQIMGSRGIVMSESGYLQHPEIHALEPEEYDEFIANPYDCIVEKIIPRVYTSLNVDSARRSIAYVMGYSANADYRAKMGRIFSALADRYGFFNPNPANNSRGLAPLDLLSDYPRGFTGISKDIKRCPEKVLAATEAILPMAVKAAKPAVPSYMGSAFMPGHMPTFMRMKEFEKFYYPSFAKLIHATAENGQQFRIFCEDNWMRYLDYMQDLPMQTRFYFEYGDPKLVKEKLGKKHIVAGLYPIVLTKTGTKEQCIDKAKEILDAMAPGGNYYFTFDKSNITLGSTNLDNFYAVLDYVHDNGKYNNAGQPSVTGKKEDTIHKCLKDIPEFKSKYYISAEEYASNNTYPIPEVQPVAFKQVQQYEDAVFKAILSYI